MKKKILFRVDGGRVWGISMGHLRRCLILATALSARFKVIFVMKNYPDGVAYARKHGVEVDLIRRDDNSNETLLKICRKHSPCKIIFDLHSNPYANFLKSVRKDKVQTIVFDTLGEFFGLPDILINDLFLPKRLKYKNSKGTKVFLGPKYFLMNTALKGLPIRKKIKDVLITMGGSDPAGLTLKIMKVLVGTRIFPGSNIHVVLGPCFTEDKEVYGFAKKHAFLRIYKDPDNFFELLNYQDIVVTAAGRTLYECASLGRPVIVVASIEHESVISNEYAKTCGCFNIGMWKENKSPNKLVEFLHEYKENYKLRESISMASSRLFDSKGLSRVLKIINSDSIYN